MQRLKTNILYYMEPPPRVIIGFMQGWAVETTPGFNQWF